ncbi:unnamed protein product [Pylaiella littoralis]
MTTVPGCFACHVDCATGCATDDQPYNHPAFVNYKYHPPSFDEDGLRSRNASVESSLSEKGVGVERSDTQGTVSVPACGRRGDQPRLCPFLLCWPSYKMWQSSFYHTCSCMYII